MNCLYLKSMNNVWLTVKEVSQLLGKSERTIQFYKEKYQYRTVISRGKMGNKIEIALNSLPHDVQKKYYNSDETNYIEFIAKYSGKKQDEAFLKLSILKRWRSSKKSVKDFLQDYNEEHPNETVSLYQFYDWKKKYKEGGINALVDERGCYKRKDSISPEAWEYFYSLYMRESKPSIQRCYELTRDAFPVLPHVKTFERAVRKIPKMAMVRYRDGEKAFHDLLPAMERSRMDIQSNDIWFSDHHVMDVAVKNDMGKVFRPFLTVFFDARSNKVISLILREKAPDAGVVKRCFKEGVLKYGLPKELYFDNGKDYREKSFRNSFPAAITNLFDINIIYATPYHGQAKTVERFFKTLEDRFCKLLPSYLGKDAKQRPAAMKKPFKDLQDDVPHVDSFRALLENFVYREYNNTKSRGIDMDNQSPNTVYTQNLQEKREVQDIEFFQILCGSFEERTVTKSGIQFEQRFYYSSDLMGHLGEKVYINYDSTNMDELNVFSLELSHICKVKVKRRTPFRNTTKDDIKEAKREIRRNKKYMEEYKPSSSLDMYSIIARKQAQEYTEREEEAAENTVSIFEKIYAHKEHADTAGEAEEINVREKLMKIYGSV